MISRRPHNRPLPTAPPTSNRRSSHPPTLHPESRPSSARPATAPLLPSPPTTVTARPLFHPHARPNTRSTEPPPPALATVPPAPLPPHPPPTTLIASHPSPHLTFPSRIASSTLLPPGRTLIQTPCTTLQSLPTPRPLVELLRRLHHQYAVAHRPLAASPTTLQNGICVRIVAVPLSALADLACRRLHPPPRLPQRRPGPSTRPTPATLPGAPCPRIATTATLAEAPSPRIAIPHIVTNRTLRIESSRRHSTCLSSARSASRPTPVADGPMQIA